MLGFVDEIDGELSIENVGGVIGSVTFD